MTGTLAAWFQIWKKYSRKFAPLSKASVSMRIRDLERSAEVSLVRRTRGSFARIAQSFAAVRDLAAVPRGPVRVTAPVALGRGRHRAGSRRTGTCRGHFVANLTTRKGLQQIRSVKVTKSSPRSGAVLQSRPVRMMVRII